MTLVADDKILTSGSLENCMYESNTMSMAERYTYTNLWIQEEADLLPFPTKIAELKIDGKEQYFSVSQIKTKREEN